jgi:hypothetical protein
VRERRSAPSGEQSAIPFAKNATLGDVGPTTETAIARTGIHVIVTATRMVEDVSVAMAMTMISATVGAATTNTKGEMIDPGTATVIGTAPAMTGRPAQRTVKTAVVDTLVARMMADEGAGRLSSAHLDPVRLQATDPRR